MGREIDSKFVVPSDSYNSYVYEKKKKELTAFLNPGQARIHESNKKDISVQCLQISPDKFSSFNVSCLEANSQVQIPRIARVSGECGDKGGAEL